MGKDVFKIIVVMAIVAIFAGLSAEYRYGTVEDVSFSVTGKDRVSYGSGDDLKNSSDIQGAIENRSYQATV